MKTGGESLEAVSNREMLFVLVHKTIRDLRGLKEIASEMNFHLESCRVLVYAKQITSQESVIFHFLLFMSQAFCRIISKSPIFKVYMVSA